MQTLIPELTRLYLPTGAATPEALAQHLSGQATSSFRLTDADGKVRAMAIPFDQEGDREDARHWSRLCTVANALQAELGFPAPAVSITGASGYRLWLSLETPVRATHAQDFVRLLRQAYFPDAEPGAYAVSDPVELPPCLNKGTGKWAAFIHPGMGASFVGDSGLDMAPPLAGQVGFLEGLHGISSKQFAHGLDVLRQSQGSAPAAMEPALESKSNADGLLLKDATLEDIIQFLHSKNIEPTFRHLIRTD